MSKPKAKTRKPKTTSRDKAKFERSAVVAALGDATEQGLPESYFVKRRHIMDAYGLSGREVSKLIRCGTLVEKHFVFEG